MSTFRELQRKILLRLKRSDGLAYLSCREGINEARRVLAMVEDFEELQARSTTAATVGDQKSYDVSSDWSLTRCKDILGIIVVDGSNSRKLVYKNRSWIDERYPYPEDLSTKKPVFYTKRGLDYELILIPDDAYTLYIDYTQWPLALDADSDENDLVNQESVIVALATDIAQSLIENTGVTDWTGRARNLMQTTVSDQRSRPDRSWVAQPFRASSERSINEYWKDPLVGRDV